MCLIVYIGKLYGDASFVEERHRHRYEVNPELTASFEDKGMHFVGHDESQKRMEIMELDNHPFFLAVQYHPEFLSRPLRPSPPFLGKRESQNNEYRRRRRCGDREIERQGDRETEKQGDKT